jgi:hypothetical protein
MMPTLLTNTRILSGRLVSQSSVGRLTDAAAARRPLSTISRRDDKSSSWKHGVATDPSNSLKRPNMRVECEQNERGAVIVLEPTGVGARRGAARRGVARIEIRTATHAARWRIRRIAPHFWLIILSLT